MTANEHLCIHPVGVKVEKPWGWTMTRHLDEQTALVEIFVKAGGFSSIHCHERMANAFLVLSGCLAVASNLPPSPLYRGDSLLIEAGIHHDFYADGDTSALEIYHALPGGKIDVADIRRFSENGVGKLKRL